MIKCDFCKKEFSEKVIDLHVKRCKKAKIVTENEEKVTENEEIVTGNIKKDTKKKR